MSRFLILFAVLSLLVPAARADEPSPEAHAFLEIVTPRQPVYVGEPFTLSLRIGIDRAFFDEHAVQLFRRRMDIPVQIEAPWLAGPPGTRPLEVEAPRADVPLAVEGREARASTQGEQIRGDLRFEVVELSRRYLPEEVGTHALEATLRFGYATRFEEDFLGGRLAVDRRDVLVSAPPFTLAVVPLPESGKPAFFDGAVGRFHVSATLTSGADDVLALALVIEGEGNLPFVDPPAPERLVGFHVYGLVDDHRAGCRGIVYEIAPLEGTAAVPAIPFAFFDPAPPAGYHTARTDPIPLATPTQVPATAKEAAPQGDLPWSWLFGVTGLVLAGAAFARLRRKRVARAVADPPPSAWSARLAEDGVDPAEVLTETLATHLGVGPAAVIGPRLGERLVAAGVEPDLAARTARTLERLVGARFGGVAGGPDETMCSQVAGLLEALDVALRRDDEHGGTLRARR